MNWYFIAIPPLKEVKALKAIARWQPGNLFDIAAQPILEYRWIRFTPSCCLDVQQDSYPMYYPEGIIIIIIMSLTPVSSSYEDIGGVPSMQSCYSAGMKRCGICMEERSPLWVRRSKSEETLCRLLITMVEETFDISRSWVDHGRPVMNLKSGYVEGENSKWKVKQRKMICGPFLIGCQAQ